MVERTIIGWLVIVSSYFLTLGAMFTLYFMLLREPTDHNWDVSGAFIGIPLLIIPYLLAGLYANRVFVNKRSGALWISIVPVISERVLIYLIGYLLVRGGGSSNGITTMMFIRGEAAPYYTYTYMIAGVISVLICFMIASYKKGWSLTKLS